MDVLAAIKARRAYRSLEPVAITVGLISDLAGAAALAPSCFNKQPWRYIFMDDPAGLEKMHQALSRGNEWARRASLIVAVAGRREDDCIMKDGRGYFLFDIGLSCAGLILRATELGLVAHPIAGFDPVPVKEALEIPSEMAVVALIVVARHSPIPDSGLSPDQARAEAERPPRRPLQEFAFSNRYGREISRMPS